MIFLIAQHRIVNLYKKKFMRVSTTQIDPLLRPSSRYTEFCSSMGSAKLMQVKLASFSFPIKYGSLGIMPVWVSMCKFYVMRQYAYFYLEMVTNSSALVLMKVFHLASRICSATTLLLRYSLRPSKKSQIAIYDLG